MRVRMEFKTLVFTGLGVLGLIVVSQAKPVENLTLESVTFGGGNYEIYKDKGLQTRYIDPTSGSGPLPHWKQGRAENFPVCYRSATPVSAEAKFSVDPDDATAKVKVKGVAGPYEFAEQELEPEDGKLTYSMTAASPNLPGEVRPGDPFNITWQFQKPDGSWAAAGVSENRMYVTLNTPTPPKLFHSLVHLGCNGNDGTTDAGELFNKIWDKFKGLSVSRADGSGLTYYGEWITPHFSTAGILKDPYNSGQCGAWARLLEDTLLAQGISLSQHYVRVKPSAANVKLLVKNWNFNGTGNSGDTDYPYVNIPKEIPVGYNLDPMNGWFYRWDQLVEVTDATGVSGQGAANPLSIFENHQLLKVDSEVDDAVTVGFYDPSYGKFFYSVSDLEDQSIAGYGIYDTVEINEAAVNLDLNRNGTQNDTVRLNAMLIKQNPAGDDLVEY